MARPLKARGVQLALLAVFAAAVAVAQQPLIPPIYYLSSLPELVEGVPLSGELTSEDGQNFKDGSRVDLALLYAEPGQQLRLTLSSSDFDPVLSVYDAAGQLIDSNDDDYEGTSTDAGLRLEGVAGGRYLLVISGVSAYEFGSYSLMWGRGSSGAQVEAIDLPVPGTLSSTLDGSSTSLLGSGFSGPAQWYRFTLSDPLLVDINMTSSAFDPVLILSDETGAQLAVNDDGGSYGGLDARITLLLDAGRYTLAAGGYQPGEGGDYQLDVQLYFPME